MKLRQATLSDLDAIARVESICFPEAEAATGDIFRGRLARYSRHFWLLEDGEVLVGFINGMVTDLEHLSDIMYENPELHDEAGKWQMIFGVDVVPDYRGRGCAGILLHRMIDDAREQKRKGLVLTCKAALVPWYERFGFGNEGRSESTHGGVTWHEMRLRFGSLPGD